MKTSDSPASSYCGSPWSVLRVRCGRAERPAEAERTVSGTRVVRKGQLRPESGASGTGRDGHGHRACAGDRIGGELLADAADGAAAFGQLDFGCGNGERRVATSLFLGIAATAANRSRTRDGRRTYWLIHVRSVTCGLRDSPCLMPSGERRSSMGENEIHGRILTTFPPARNVRTTASALCPMYALCR